MFFIRYPPNIRLNRIFVGNLDHAKHLEFFDLPDSQRQLFLNYSFIYFKKRKFNRISDNTLRYLDVFYYIQNIKMENDSLDKVKTNLLIGIDKNKQFYFIFFVSKKGWSQNILSHI
jgi:hypothetical protein